MKIAAAWAALGILTIGFIGQSESFQDCEKSRKDHRKYEALHHKGSVVIKSIVRFELHVACTVETTHENEGPLTLLASILVAGFTGTLWYETNRLWRAGEKQIIVATKAADAAIKSADVAERALIDLERPMLFIGIITQPLAWGKPARFSKGPFPPISYIFTNYGKTPAIIDYWEVSVDTCNDPDDVLGFYRDKNYITKPILTPGREISGSVSV